MKSSLQDQACNLKDVDVRVNILLFKGLSFPTATLKKQPGYIVCVTITTTFLLFRGQLTVTSGSSRRSTRSKGRRSWKASGVDVW